MIKSFRDKDSEAIFQGYRVPRFEAFGEQARRRLRYLHRAKDLNDLRVPPSNRFHALSGDRKGQYALWINRRWRIVFRWRAGNAHDVEIVDYHG